MKLVVVKCSKNWYSIERAEHDGREWFEVELNDTNCSVFRRSARIGNADVEGTASEMQALATAIKNRQDIRFKRCAVKFVLEGVLLFSPRNSQGGVEPCKLEDADELAESILKTVKEARP